MQEVQRLLVSHFAREGLKHSAMPAVAFMVVTLLESILINGSA